jgi:hypothetical protein
MYLGTQRVVHGFDRGNIGSHAKIMIFSDL